MKGHRLFARLLPNALRLRFRHAVANFKRPKMVWGYQNPDGVFFDDVRISDTAFMYHPERICLSSNVFVWHYSILDGIGGLEIGEGTQIGAWVGIFTHSSHLAIRLYGPHYQSIPEDKKRSYPIKKVTIGRYVFIGAGSRILPGVHIGDGCLIAANSVVGKNIPPFSIVKGDPAEVTGCTDDLDKKHLVAETMQSYYKNFL